MNRMNNKRQILSRFPFCLLGLLVLTLLTSQVAAQVFDSGPSDSNLFDTVLNVPTDPDIGDFESLGGDGFTTQLNVSDGGTIGEFFSANPGCEVNVSGGTVADFFYSFGGEVNISGGNVGICMDIFSDSLINISGGNIGDNLRVQAGAEINLFGSDFLLDGQLLDPSLTSGVAFTIPDREVTLSGLFADGSPFSFDLNIVNATNQNFFSTGATLTVTLVSADPEIILGDCNLDGVVDFFDISPFIGSITTDSFLAQADVNQDGSIDFFDIAPFIDILTGN